MGTGASKPKLATILLIVALMASSLIAVQAYTVDSIPKPSIPEFTVKIVAYPYDIPPETITHINEYTGETTVTNKPGKHVENKSIEITIKNQPFTPYTITKHTGYNHETGESYTYDRNSTVNLFYYIGVKGHYGNDWKPVGTPYTSYVEGPQSNAQLDSKYTVITIAADYPNDALLDFRVQTRIGYYVAYGRTAVIFGYDFYGQESGYSNIQTLKMGEVGSTAVPSTDQPTATPTTPTMQPTPTPSATTTPTQNPPETSNPVTQTGVVLGLDWGQTAIALLCITVTVLAAALTFSNIRNAKRNSAGGVG